MRRTRRKWLLPVIEACMSMNTMSCLWFGHCPCNIPGSRVSSLHCLGNVAMAYLDDLIIISASEEEHKQHIKKLLVSLGKTT